VSENGDSHGADTTKVAVTSQGKERLKTKAFRRPRKTDSRERRTVRLSQQSWWSGGCSADSKALETAALHSRAQQSQGPWNRPSTGAYCYFRLSANAAFICGHFFSSFSCMSFWLWLCTLDDDLLLFPVLYMILKQAVVRGTTNPAPCCHLANDTDLLTPVVWAMAGDTNKLTFDPNWPKI